MKLHLIIPAAFLAFTPVSYAQDGGNAITIIREDGSSESIELGRKQRSTAPTGKEQSPIFNRRKAPEVVVQDASEQKIEAEEPVSVPIEEALDEPAEMPADAPAENLSVEPVIEPELVEEPQAAVPHNAGMASPAADKSSQNEVEKPVAKPRKKPFVEPQPPPPELEHVQQEPEPLDQPLNPDVSNRQPISQNKALSLAIDAAPPADDFQIFKNYQGQTPIYQVIFRSGKDFYEVQVDAFEGIILFSGYRDDLEGFSPKAGHLPKKLSP